MYVKTVIKLHIPLLFCEMVDSLILKTFKDAHSSYSSLERIYKPYLQ